MHRRTAGDEGPLRGGDATRPEDLQQQWDTVIDSGLFHVFDDGDRARLVQSLSAVVPAGGHYLLLCFNDRQPGTGERRRISQAESRAAFELVWRIDSIEPATFELAVRPRGAAAWLACVTRTGPHPQPQPLQLWSSGPRR